MREVPLSAYTGGTWDAVMAAADRGGYLHTAVTHLDGCGRPTDAKLVPGDLIVIENAHTEVILWLDYSGELVRLVEDE